MYVIKEMRINKFERKPIVSNRQLFASKGEQPATIVSKATSDCFDEPSLQGASKTKLLGLAKEISDAAIAHAKEGEFATPEMKTSAVKH